VPPPPPRQAPPPPPADSGRALRSDALLDHLELEPAEDLPIVEEEIVADEFDLGPVSDSPAEGIEEPLPVDGYSFDVPPEAPKNPKDTLVSTQQETDDMRRRIARPALPDVDLIEMEVEEEELEQLQPELTPEPEPPPPPPRRQAAPRPPPPPLDRPTPRAFPVVAAPSIEPEGPPLSKALDRRVGSMTIPPLNIELPASMVAAGQPFEVPIEVTLPRDGTPITIQLQLQIRLKLTP
jgi:hypothetical protein